MEMRSPMMVFSSLGVGPVAMVVVVVAMGPVLLLLFYRR